MVLFACVGMKFANLKCFYAFIKKKKEYQKIKLCKLFKYFKITLPITPPFPVPRGKQHGF